MSSPSSASHNEYSENFTRNFLKKILQYKDQNIADIASACLMFD